MPGATSVMIHEAGHAVAAAVRGTPLKRASLSGVTTLVRRGCQRARRAEAIIALSGPAAEDWHQRYSAGEREQLWRSVTDAVRSKSRRVTCPHHHPMLSQSCSKTTIPYLSLRVIV